MINVGSAPELIYPHSQQVSSAGVNELRAPIALDRTLKWENDDGGEECLQKGGFRMGS